MNEEKRQLDLMDIFEEAASFTEADIAGMVELLESKIEIRHVAQTYLTHPEVVIFLYGAKVMEKEMEVQL